MKKLFILCMTLLVFGNVNAVVLVALSESNLTTRENTVLGLLNGFNLSPDILGSNPAWDELTAYNLIVATEEGALDATMINDLITNGKKVMLLYKSGSPLGGTWTTDNVINHRYLIVENDSEVFNGYQSNIWIHMQTGNPSCHVSGSLPAGWTVVGSNYYATKKTVLFRKHSPSNGKGLVFTYNPLSFTGPAKNFFALAIQWLTGDSPLEGIIVPEGNVAFILTTNEYNEPEDLTESENNHYNRLLEQGYTVTFVPFGELSESDLEQAVMVTAVEYPSIDRHTINHLFSEGKNQLLLKTSAAPVGGTWDINNVINNQRLVIEQNAALFDGYSTNLNFRAETKAHSASITAMYPAGWTIIGSTFYTSNKTILFKEDNSSGAKALVMTYDPANYTQPMMNFADRAIEWIEGTPPHEGIIVPEGHAAFIISGYEDSYPPELTDSENSHYNTLLSQGFDVTFIRFGRLSNSDLSEARLINAVEYPSIDMHSINNHIASGKNLLLMKTSAAPIGGNWDVNNVINNQRLTIDESEALFKGFVSSLNFRAELQAFSASITSDYPAGWNIIGRTYYQNNKTVLYKVDNQSHGKALVITYDPANFSESMKNFNDLAYYYLEGEAPFEGISIPEGNVAFIITRYNDQGVPDITPAENNYYNFLMNQGYQISFLRFSRIFNSDFSEADFITGIEFPSLNLDFIEEKLDSGINILAAFSSGSIIGGQWNSHINTSARNLIVEDNTCFLSEYEVDETIIIQQSGDAFYVQADYPETWKILGRNALNVNHKTVLSKTSNLARAIVFSYNTGMLTEDGTNLLQDIIDFFNQPFEDVYYTVTLDTNPQDLDAELSGAGQYMEGETVNIFTGEVDGYEFVAWTGSAQDIPLLDDHEASTTSFLMPDRNVVFTANFIAIPETHTLTLIAEPAGGGTVDGDGEYEEGADVTLTGTANENWEFINWSDADGNEISDEAEFVYTMPAEDVTLTATFQESVNIQAQKEKNPYLYPNPFKDNIFLMNADIISFVRITDLLGSIILEKQLGNESTTALLNLGYLRNGVYIIQMQDYKGRQWVERIVKQ